SAKLSRGQWANWSGQDGRSLSPAARCWMARTAGMSGGSSRHRRGADMGRLLDTLLQDLRLTPPATPATPATLPASGSRKVAESQVSQGVDPATNTKEQRAHLLALAADEGLPAGLVHGLADADVSACAGLPDAVLRAYLRALEAGRRMD